jgi:PAS domain S-box-containing protein
MSKHDASDTFADRAETSERWRLVAEHSPDALVVSSGDGRILGANPAACAMFGRTEQELCAMSRDDLVVLDEALTRYLDERLRTGRASAVLTLQPRGRGKLLVEMSGASFRSPSGEVWTTSRLRDVTDRERRIRALEILASAGPALASSLDLEATLRHATALIVPSLADICTIDLIEASGVNRVAVAHRDPMRAAAFERKRDRSLRPGAAVGADYVMLTGQPSFVYEPATDWPASRAPDSADIDSARAAGVRSLVSVPLTTRARTIGALTLMSDGGVPAFGDSVLPLVQALAERIAMAIDNAHHLADAVEARRVRDDAIEARKRRDEVLGIVAHDLRGPLNAIYLAATLLGRKSMGEETETIAVAVRRAEALIRDLLLASKMQGAPIPLNRQDESVESIADELRALFALEAAAKSVRFAVATEGSAAVAQVDRHRVMQMVSNLLANAIQFTPRGGGVRLNFRCSASETVITVSDTGPGISPAEMTHIFDRFWQGDSSRDVGAGLGLWISQGIATAHGGTISAASDASSGTTFTVTLPRELARAADGPQPQSRAGGQPALSGTD